MIHAGMFQIRNHDIKFKNIEKSAMDANTMK